MHSHCFIISAFNHWTSASGMIRRWRQIVQMISQVPGRIVERHHSHLKGVLSDFAGEREMMMFIDGRRTFPVFGLLAHPTPSLLVSAHNTWQKFPGMIIIEIVMRIRNLYLESRFQTQSHIVPPRCTRETPEVHQQPILINISLLRSGLRYIFRFKVNLRWFLTKNGQNWVCGYG